MKARQWVTSFLVLGISVFSSFVARASQGELNLQFGQICPVNETCNYTGAYEDYAPPAGAVKMFCGDGDSLNVLSATYYTSTAQESCANSANSHYVDGLCNDKNSCAFSFTNNNCGGDPDYGVQKQGKATVQCVPDPAYRRSVYLQFGEVCPTNANCYYSGAYEDMNPPAGAVQMFCQTGDTLKVINSTYYTASASESCSGPGHHYVDTICDGNNSCSVSFNNQNCGGDPDPGVQKQGKAEVQCSNEVRYIGRFNYSDPAGPQANISNAEIRIGFNGTSLGITLASAQAEYFSVVVDDGKPNIISVSSGTSQLQLATGLPMGLHRVLFIRNNEPGIGGVSQLLNIDYGNGTPAELDTPSSPTIEVLGDSYSNGLAVYGLPFGAATENSNISWGALASQALGAEFRDFAYSGARSIDIDGIFNQDPVTGAPYDFKLDRPATAVAILLGDNDSAQSINSPPPTSYSKALKSLVDKEFARSPHAQVFFAQDQSGTLKHFEWVIAQYPPEVQSQFHVMQFTTKGIDPQTGHPTQKLHQIWAAAFVKAYKSAFGIP